MVCVEMPSCAAIDGSPSPSNTPLTISSCRTDRSSEWAMHRHSSLIRRLDGGPATLLVIRHDHQNDQAVHDRDRAQTQGCRIYQCPVRRAGRDGVRHRGKPARISDGPVCRQIHRYKLASSSIKEREKTSKDLANYNLNFINNELKARGSKRKITLKEIDPTYRPTAAELRNKK